MTPRSHADCVNLIRLIVSEMGGLSLDYKTGGLEDNNGRVIKFGSKGAADTICCYNGQFYAIEAKLGRDAWRPEQQKFAAAVERAGGKYVLARWPGGEETVRLALDTGVRCRYQNADIEEDTTRSGPSHDDGRPCQLERGRSASNPDAQGVHRSHGNPSQHEGG